VDGSRSGTHTVDFTPTETGFTVKTSVSIRVNVSFFMSYQFQQYGQEHWENGNVTLFDYVTHDGGATTKVSGRRQGENLVIDGPRRRGLSVAAATTPSFWNPETLKYGSIVNPQTGELARLSATPVSSKTVKFLNQTVEGQGFAVDSFFKGQVWFDMTQRLLGFWFVKSGYRVDMLRVL
jgi:hypothetical protein